jgi:hypothetical protein
MRNRLIQCVFVAVSIVLPSIVLASAASAQDAPKFVVNMPAEKRLACLPPGDLYLTVETFSSLDAAKAAESDTAVEMD